MHMNLPQCFVHWPKKWKVHGKEIFPGANWMGIFAVKMQWSVWKLKGQSSQQGSMWDAETGQILDVICFGHKHQFPSPYPQRFLQPSIFPLSFFDKSIKTHNPLSTIVSLKLLSDSLKASWAVLWRLSYVTHHNNKTLAGKQKEDIHDSWTGHWLSSCNIASFAPGMSPIDSIISSFLYGIAWKGFIFYWRAGGF